MIAREIKDSHAMAEGRMFGQLFLGLDQMDLLETIIAESHLGIVSRGQPLPDLWALELDRAILDFVEHACKVA